ncbi:ArsR/SmtB family transcription factor [Rhodococcoides yunnanense]|uniref:ArsR/SmtB family transcription factor n=1 Tax=Rhodococcoides yunnanense TaxID=278209 RepID=UPI0009331B5D|nr:metalloregulator ArsR/SmtB family transcription factor [Rhodococcus yunnanensis]
MRTPRPIADVSQLKALAHPLRVRLLYALRAEGTATASQLGQIVDESPASVSYHLRKLADAGFAHEAPDLGTDGRERWWRVPEEGFSWSSSDFEGTPEGRAASNAAKQALVENQFARQREYDSTSDSWSDEWKQASFSTDHVLQLTAEEADRMREELRAVLSKWNEHSLDRKKEDHAGTEHVMVFAHGFPYNP